MRSNLLLNIITLSQSYVVISYRHGLPPRVEVQRVLRVHVIYEAQAADDGVSGRPPELREDLRVRRDGWRGVGIGKGKYGPCRLRTAPQVVRRLRRPRDREHLLSCGPLVVGHGGNQGIVGRAAQDDVSPTVVAARFRVFDRRDHGASSKGARLHQVRSMSGVRSA